MLIAIPAGISKMKFDKFIFYSFLGMLPYNLAFLYIGFLVGGNRESLIAITDKYFGRFDWYFGIALVILIVWYIIRHIGKKHASHE